VDRSRHGELLRINFNMSFPALSCEFATLDVSDALGTVSFALTADGCSWPSAIVSAQQTSRQSHPCFSAGLMLDGNQVPLRVRRGLCVLCKEGWCGHKPCR